MLVGSSKGIRGDREGGRGILTPMQACFNVKLIVPGLIFQKYQFLKYQEIFYRKILSIFKSKDLLFHAVLPRGILEIVQYSNIHGVLNSLRRE
jgi:hypothetical protein